MKFIHTADLHLSKNLRLDDFKKSLYQISDYAISDNKVKFIIVAGDVYHKRTPDNEASAVFTGWLSKLALADIHVIVLTGTHDIDISSHSLFPLKNLEKILKKVHVIDYLGVCEIPQLDVTVFGIPHFLTMDLLQLKTQLDEFVQASFISHYKIVVGHFPVLGALVSNIYSIQEKDESFIVPRSFLDIPSIDYIALGHIHKAQKVLSNAYYAGSIERVNFGEKENKPSFFVVEKNEKLVVTSIPLSCREMIDVEITGSTDLQNLSFSEGALVRIVLKEKSKLDLRQIRKVIEDKGGIFYGTSVEYTNKCSDLNFSNIKKRTWKDMVLEKIEQSSGKYNVEMLKKMFLESLE